MQSSFPLAHISYGPHSPSSPNLPPMLGLFILDPKPKRYPLLVQGSLLPSNQWAEGRSVFFPLFLRSSPPQAHPRIYCKKTASVYVCYVTPLSKEPEKISPNVLSHNSGHYPSLQPQQASTGNTETNQNRETGFLTEDPHYCLLPCRSNPPVLYPALRQNTNWSFSPHCPHFLTFFLSTSCCILAPNSSSFPC